MRVQRKYNTENKKKSTQSVRSAQSARSAVCSLHGLPFGVIRLALVHTAQKDGHPFILFYFFSKSEKGNY